MVNLKTSERSKIQQLYREGCSVNHISRKMKHARFTVQRWIDKGLIIENKVPSTGQGRKRLINKKQMSRLKTILLKNKYEGSRSLLPGINQELKINISDRTLRNYSRLLGLLWGRPRKVPALTDIQKQKRLAWAKKHLNTDWKKWIFTDEKIFRAGSIPIGVRYEKGKKPQAPCKPWSGQIFVWSGIHYNIKISPQTIEENLNSDGYTNILGSTLHFNNKSGWILQQDNARPHVSKKTRFWMETKRIKVCPDWCPNSPDLNPIENLWGIVSYFVRQRRPKNKFQLFKIVMEELDRVPRGTIKNLINSMPERIHQVIKEKGGAIKY
jgi:transposase